MAPRYAPSLRSRLAPLLLSLQIGFIVIYALYIEIGSNTKADGTTSISSYPEFQDVNVMVILGFGFLGTFLVRYGYSATGFNLLVAVMATQWAVILNGMELWYYRGKIRVDLRSLVVAEMCAASALISIGALLGKTNPVHLVLIALVEVSGFILNRWLLQTLLMPFEKEKFDRQAGLFSMLGSVFLWMFWPSFNSVLVDHRSPGRKLGAVCSTYLALAVSAVTAAAVSVLSSPKGKLHPVL
ncbi:Ammonium transporter Rh type B [Liparis tanakae]|uniref:Ammonium transporter Rh type B n=1 Tax=Liparis tanakae TaxID=230148 RepID=A0A4Z2H5L4_9TELE|nr:Ammonium transporter Rh type B [Liparis tanakae]